MADFQNTIDLLGDAAVCASIVDRSIEEYNDDVLTEMGMTAFSRCASLTSVNLPNVKTLRREAFKHCTSLKSVNLPNLITGEDFCFSDCTALQIIRFPKLTSITNNMFIRCSALKTLILGSPTVCSLYSAMSVGGIENGGTVYVPQKLITEYQNATNWSSLYSGGKCSFVAIEGSEYE